jgi:hypothetical protein
LSGQGTPTDRSDVVPGAALANAERRKARTYPELVGRGRARLVVLGCEVGGTWSNDALATVPLVAAHRASLAPELLRPSVIQACLYRWWSLLSVAAQSKLASIMCGDAGAYFGFAAKTPPHLGGAAGPRGRRPAREPVASRRHRLPCLGGRPPSLLALGLRVGGSWAGPACALAA